MGWGNGCVLNFNNYLNNNTFFYLLRESCYPILKLIFYFSINYYVANKQTNNDVEAKQQRS